MRLLLPITLALAFVSAIPATAQLEFGGYFDARGAYTTVNSSGAVLPGAGIGVVLNGQFGLGARIAAIVPTVRADSLGATGRSLFISLFYYGVTLEYTHNPEDFFQFGGAVLIGAGDLSFRESSSRRRQDSSDAVPNYSFSLIEPALAGQLAFNENLRLRASLGWRVTFNEDSGAGPGGTLSGPVGTLGFRIGIFSDEE